MVQCIIILACSKCGKLRLVMKNCELCPEKSFRKQLLLFPTSGSGFLVVLSPVVRDWTALNRKNKTLLPYMYLYAIRSTTRCARACLTSVFFAGKMLNFQPAKRKLHYLFIFFLVFTWLGLEGALAMQGESNKEARLGTGMAICLTSKMGNPWSDMKRSAISRSLPAL